jgi:hypothetical protein
MEGIKSVSFGVYKEQFGDLGHIERDILCDEFDVFSADRLDVRRIAPCSQIHRVGFCPVQLVENNLAFGWGIGTSDQFCDLLAGHFVHQYWGHRLVHTPLFWHVHRIHHAATELNVLTTFRQHPLEPVVQGFVTLVSALIFLDVPQRVLLIYFFVGTVTDLLAHSQLPWGYGWVGRWLVQSPRFHQLHHSLDQEHQDLHFSSCPLWDHVFGTFCKGTKQTSRYGIADPAYEIRPLTQFALDAWIFYANLVRLVARAIRRAVRRPDHRSPALRNTLSPRRIRPSPG